MSIDIFRKEEGRAGLSPLLQKNDRKANVLIIVFSVLVFLIVASLHPLNKALGIQPNSLGFDVHVFAKANAIINTLVTILLLIAFYLVKQRKYAAHRNTMFAAMVLSALFLLSYIAHHILAGDASFKGQGIIRPIYYALLSTHIALAAIILPFILFTAYRGMTGEYAKHKTLSRYTFPLWLYVSITGPVIYLMISPYYT